MRRMSVGLLNHPIKQLIADQGNNIFTQNRVEEEAQLAAFAQFGEKIAA
jgi:hypothetical protein